MQYEEAFQQKDILFGYACDRFYENLDSVEEKKFKAFKKENKHWLEDYTLFMACGKHHGMQPWNTWEKEIAQRKPEALKNTAKSIAPT